MHSTFGDYWLTRGSVSSVRLPDPDKLVDPDGAVSQLPAGVFSPSSLRRALGLSPGGSVFLGFESWKLILERIANSFQNKKKCPSFYVKGTCEQSHMWAKEIFCGREWCMTCGGNWGSAHKRRFARWLPKVMQLRTMGYLVVTIPPEDRQGLRTKADLVEAGKVASKVVRRYFPKRGLRRWHWFGEKPPFRYHPHLNFLLDAGRVNKPVLNALRRDLKMCLGLSREPQIKYQYTTVVPKMVHALKYVTRSTFLEYDWDSEMAEELFGFRNVAWWGKWIDAPAWIFKPGPGDVDIEAITKLVAGKCPICGSAIKWGGVEDIRTLRLCDPLSFGGGFHSLRSPPGARRNGLADIEMDALSPWPGALIGAA